MVVEAPQMGVEAPPMVVEEPGMVVEAAHRSLENDSQWELIEELI